MPCSWCIAAETSCPSSPRPRSTPASARQGLNSTTYPAAQNQFLSPTSDQAVYGRAVPVPPCDALDWIVCIIDYSPPSCISIDHIFIYASTACRKRNYLDVVAACPSSAFLLVVSSEIATDRQDHLGVRLLRPVPLPCCCRLSAARSNSNLTDHMLRAILFFFLLGASSNPQACGRCSDRARFPWWSPCMHLECACMQCARGRPRRRVVLYLYRRSRLLRCSGVRVTSISCVEFMDLTVIAQEDSRR